MPHPVHVSLAVYPGVKTRIANITFPGPCADAANVRRAEGLAFLRCDLHAFDLPEPSPIQVTALVEHLLSEKQQARHLKAAIIFLVIFTVLLLAAMTGITYAVVASLKDTKVRGLDPKPQNLQPWAAAAGGHDFSSG